MWGWVGGGAAGPSSSTVVSCNKPNYLLPSTNAIGSKLTKRDQGGWCPSEDTSIVRTEGEIMEVGVLVRALP